MEREGGLDLLWFSLFAFRFPLFSNKKRKNLSHKAASESAMQKNPKKAHQIGGSPEAPKIVVLLH